MTMRFLRISSCKTYVLPFLYSASVSRPFGLIEGIRARGALLVQEVLSALQGRG